MENSDNYLKNARAYEIACMQKRKSLLARGLVRLSDV